MDAQQAAITTTFQEYLQDFQQYIDQEHLSDYGFLKRRTARSKFDRVCEQMERQAAITVDYAAAIAEGGSVDTDAYHRAFLRTNPFLDHYEGRREAALRETLTDHFDTVAADVAPLLDADVATPSFDAMMQAAYDREEAEAVLAENFTYVDALKRYMDDMYLSLGPFNVASFADEVAPVIADAEDWLLEQRIPQDLDRIYGDDGE